LHLIVVVLLGRIVVVGRGLAVMSHLAMIGRRESAEEVNRRREICE